MPAVGTRPATRATLLHQRADRGKGARASSFRRAFQRGEIMAVTSAVSKSAFALCLVALGACVASSDSDESVGVQSEALTTYEVGPGRTYASLKDVAGRLKPGDIVNLYGNATYAGDVNLTANGTAASKITIRGMRVNGKRPVLSGGDNTHRRRRRPLRLRRARDHRRRVALPLPPRRRHHHPRHRRPRLPRARHPRRRRRLGLAHARVRRGLHAAAAATAHHQIYMATDESAHPGSVFRMQHCYVHDGNGGNNVKSRAERNEIYYNWIEGALYHELELIGPDGQRPERSRARTPTSSATCSARREHAGTSCRVGGDGTGETNGRYRFVNNTIVAQARTTAPSSGSSTASRASRCTTTRSSRRAAGAVRERHRRSRRQLGRGEPISGTNNWVGTNASNVPTNGRAHSAARAPVSQASRRMASGRRRRARSSMRALRPPASPSGHAFPNPLALPGTEPPVRQLPASAAAAPRSARSTSEPMNTAPEHRRLLHRRQRRRRRIHRRRPRRALVTGPRMSRSSGRSFATASWRRAPIRGTRRRRPLREPLAATAAHTA